MFNPNLWPQLDGPVTFTLDSGVELHQEAPDTFYLPPEEERTSLRPDDFAKLIFRITNGEKVAVERMWVRVREVRPEDYVGTLDNQPYCTEAIHIGLRVEFHADHVIQIRRMTA
jgi:hypothetical protein